jgi:uncharacterized membrane protein YjjP (DUF1212 family)
MPHQSVKFYLISLRVDCPSHLLVGTLYALLPGFALLLQVCGVNDMTKGTWLEIAVVKSQGTCESYNRVPTRST